MKRLSILFLVSLFILGLTSCAFAQGIQQEDRQVAPFNGIKVSTGITLYLMQGEENKVVVKADGSVIENVITETKDGTLRIYLSGRRIFRLNSSPEVYVTFSWINAIDASSGSEVIGQNTFMVDKLTLENSSGSTSHFEVECRDLEMHASSGSTIRLSGSALNLIAKSSSGSTIKSQELKVVNASLEASSGATIHVGVSGELEAAASSGGSITYYGEAIPKLLRQSSGGDIRKR